MSTATATVTVEDNVAPEAIAQDITVQLDASGNATITAADIDDGSNDACDIASLSLDVTEFTCDDVGSDNIVTLTVTDNNNNVSTTTATVTVEDNVAPEITCVDDQTRANNPGTCNYTVVGDEFDPTFNDNCSRTTVSNNYNNLASLADAVFPEGETVVEWTATDASGNKTTCSFTVTVTNEAPVITSISGPEDPAQDGTQVQLTADYTDNNLAKATWRIYTDDMLYDEYTCTDCINNEGETITGEFTPGPGVYVVELEVEDYCGVTDVLKYEFVVIYDPNGGFVTGGGWIDSPEDAMASGATGKANFGFNAKYKNGKNDTDQVDGNTNFQFKAGDLHFKSSQHDDMSLVISGKKATYTGTGSINGSGNYKFRLVAIDGDLDGGDGLDQFRIRIWGDSGVYYDNKPNSSESSDDATALGGGSIVIHKEKGNGKGNKAAEEVEKTATQTTTPEQEEIEILESMAVSPNPMHTEAWVRFSLKEDARVVLRIFDFNGREVVRLLEGAVKAKEVNELRFDRNNLPSGTYICKLTTERGHSYHTRIIID